MSATVSEYAKRLLELQARARALRDEVARLHATRHTLALRDSTVSRAAALRVASQDALTSESGVSVSATPPSHTPPRDDVASSGGGGHGGGSSSSSRRRAGTATTSVRSAGTARAVTVSSSSSSSPSLALPPEYAHELLEKIGTVRLTMRAHAAVQREKADVLAQLKAAEERNQEAEQEHIRLMELAGVSEVRGKSQHLVTAQRANAYKAELRATTQLYTQRDTLQAQLTAQTAELNRLATLLEEMTSAQEQKQDAVVILREKQARLQELRRERAALERAVHTKDQLLAKDVHGVTEEERVRAATMDRRVVMQELQKEEEAIRQNDLAIRHRALQIAKREKRLEMIGDAVAGDDLHGVDRVDVELSDALMREMDALYRAHDEADARTQSLDARIERLDGKIAAFQRATANTHKEMDAIAQNHRRYMAALQRELRAELLAKKDDMASIERDMDTLRGASARMSARSRSRHSAHADAAAAATAEAEAATREAAAAAAAADDACAPPAQHSSRHTDSVREETVQFDEVSISETRATGGRAHDRHDDTSVAILAEEEAVSESAAPPPAAAATTTITTAHAAAAGMTAPVLA